MLAVKCGISGEFREKAACGCQGGRETRQKYSKKVSLCYEKDPLNILQRIMVKNTMPLPFFFFFLLM